MLTEFLKKVLNELPTIAVAVWATLNMLGVDLSADEQAAWLAGAESVVGLAIWLLVRRRTDGPVTVYEQNKAEA